MSNRFADAPNVRTVLFQAIGAGSTCWVGGTGDAEFDSEEAERVGNEAMDRIGQISVRVDLLWKLADDWEDRSRDRYQYGPIASYVWKQAHEELVKRLGERVLPE